MADIYPFKSEGIIVPVRMGGSDLLGVVFTSDRVPRQSVHFRLDKTVRSSFVSQEISRDDLGVDRDILSKFTGMM